MADTLPSPTRQSEAQSGQAGAQPDSQQPAPEAVANPSARSSCRRDAATSASRHARQAIK